VLMDHPILHVIPWILVSIEIQLNLNNVKSSFSACPTPSLTTLTDNGCIQLQSISPYTQTPGSYVNYTCAGLITGLVSTYSHCPVEVCKTDFTWTSPSISCGTNQCYNVGSSASYQGHRTCTMTGKTCQRWDSQSPHTHSFTGANFPDGSLTAANNYCRDPDGSGYPWCFSTDPLVGKESCSVLQCSTVPINYGTCATTAPLDPTATTAVNCGLPTLLAMTDNGCIQLQSIPPYTTTAGSIINYICAGLLTDFVSSYDHCPEQICQTNGVWTNPAISCGINECYTVGNSSTYHGHRTCTFSGKTCQRWDSQTPHSHSFTAVNFPDGSLALANNYCRDPDGTGSPWCFTTDPAATDSVIQTDSIIQTDSSIQTDSVIQTDSIIQTD
ncbi:hypothetical protein ACJMK2_008395, partial [Sinanodonta woodiana]